MRMVNRLRGIDDSGKICGMIHTEVLHPLDIIQPKKPNEFWGEVNLPPFAKPVDVITLHPLFPELLADDPHKRILVALHVLSGDVHGICVLAHLGPEEIEAILPPKYTQEEVGKMIQTGYGLPPPLNLLGYHMQMGSAQMGYAIEKGAELKLPANR